MNPIETNGLCTDSVIVKRRTAVVQFAITISISLFLFQSHSAPPGFWEIRPPLTIVDLHGVAFDGTKYVAVGAEGTILISSNGHWGSFKLPNASRLRSITHANGLFVAGGETGNLISTSPNGIQWANVMNTGGSETIYGLTHAAGRYVGVGGTAGNSQAYTLTSFNGADWQPSTPGVKALKAVAFGNGLFVAVGDNGTIVSSPDGVSWTPRWSPITNDLMAITYFANSKFVVSGMFGFSLNSNDGINWFESSRASFSIRALASGGGYVVAVGRSSNTGRLHATPDGFGWPGVNLIFPQLLNAIAYGNNNWLAVGEGGIILQAHVPRLKFYQTSDGINLHLTGPAGRYRIEGTTNMTHWSSLTELDSPESFIDQFIMRADDPLKPALHFRATFLPQ